MGSSKSDKIVMDLDMYCNKHGGFDGLTSKNGHKMCPKLLQGCIA